MTDGCPRAYVLDSGPQALSVVRDLSRHGVPVTVLTYKPHSPGAHSRFAPSEDAMPTVSVIIPTRNRAAMLREAIESVRAQTFTDWELLVVDDGSTDETPAVLQACAASDARIRGLRMGEGRSSAARNAGIRTARGELVAFLDDDDRWLPDMLMRHVEQLASHPEAAFVYCLMRVEGPGVAPGTLKPQRRWPDTLESLIAHNFIPVATVMRRRCFEAYGGFDDRLGMAEDYDMWLRVALHEPFISIQEPLAIVRHHGTNKSVDRGPRFYRAHIRTFEKLLADPALQLPHRTLAVRRLAKEWYLLGRAQWLTRQPAEAAAAFARSLRLDWGVGASFIEPSDPWAVRLWKTLKPYAVVGRAGLASMGPR